MFTSERRPQRDVLGLSSNSGGAPLINHGSVGSTDNHLLSVTGYNDVSCVALGNAVTGGGTLPINNEMLSWTENCLPSSSGDNDASLAAHGITAISQKKKCQNVANGQKESVVGAHRIIHRNYIVKISMNGLEYKWGQRCTSY